MSEKGIKALVWTIILTIFILTMVGCGEKKVDKSMFIQRKGTEFVLNDAPFRFAGTNNYYLNYKDEAMIDDVIESAKAMNLKVIRLWGFLDGMSDAMMNNNAYMQTEAAVFDQIPDGARNGFEALDYVIKKASDEGIYLVIALTNNWDDFGGINQYVAWSDSATEHDDFYTDAKTKELYKNYIEVLINRENKLTGITYKNDPTIMTWELMNEPRCESDPTGITLTAWVDVMSTYIKEMDPNHMVALGDEGFFNNLGDTKWAYNGYAGVDWASNLKLATIDYGTFHLYPEHWGDDFSVNPLKSGLEWIEDHIEVAQKIGKPLVLEEFGIQKGTMNPRDLIYQQWLDKAYALGVNGTMFWILSGIDTGQSADLDGFYPDYDGFRVVNDDSRTSEIIREHALMMMTETGETKARAFITAPVNGEKVSGIFAFKMSTLAPGKKVDHYEMTLGDIKEPFQIYSSGNFVLDTRDYPLDGQVLYHIVSILDDGTQLEDQIMIELDNKKKVEKVGKSFDFDEGIGGFELDSSTYQATFGPKGLGVSEALGEKSLSVDVILPGSKDWEELRVFQKNMDNLADYVRIEYDVFFDEALVQSDGLSKPYVVANPGWVKLGVEENNQMVEALVKVTIGQKTYLKQHVVIPIKGFAEASELYVGIVGGMLAYEGEVLIDHIELIEEVYEEK